MTRTGPQLGALVAAFVVAVAFWAYSRLEQTYVTVLSVPLRLQVPPDAALAESPPPVLTFHLQGSGWQLVRLGLWERPKEAVVTLPRVGLPALVGIGRQQLVRSVPLPGDIIVLHVSPDTVTVALGRAQSRTVPVEPKVRVQLPEGWVLTELRVEPESVVVRGVGEALQGLGVLTLEGTLQMPQRREFAVEYPVNVQLPVPVEVVPARVRLRGRLEPEAELVVPDVPVSIVPSATLVSHEVLPTVVQVWLRGPLDKLLRVTPQALRAELPYAELLQDTTGVLVPRVVAPEGVHVVRVEPSGVFHWRR